MKAFLIDNNTITKYTLPLKIDDTFLITYNSSSIKDCIISFVCLDNKIYLKSNGSVNIIENDIVIDKIEINCYRKYLLKIVQIDSPLELYFIPNLEQFFKFSLNNLNSFSVGSGDNNHLKYSSRDVTGTQAMFKLMNNEWAISSVNDDNYKVFVNEKRVKMMHIKAGDVIFIAGLKIIWMHNFIWVNNPNNSLSVTQLKFINDEDTFDLNQIQMVNDEDKYAELYNKDAYFTHYPLIKESTKEAEVFIDSPPGEEKQDHTPWILTMGSTIMMTSSAFVMVFNIVYGINSGRQIVSLIPQMIMCFSMLIGSLLLPKISKSYQNKQKKEREKLREEKYTEYLNKKDREIELLVKNSIQIRNANYLSTDNCLVALEKKNRNFWWCQYKDQEFLTVRLGIGNIPNDVIIHAPEEHFTLDLDDLLAKTYDLKKKYERISNAPITISLKDHAVTSLISSAKDKETYINSLITQLIILHSGLDLKLVILTNEENKTRWDFAKYLPHIFSVDKQVRFFAINEDETKIVSNYLEEVLKERKEKENEPELVPYYLIITDDYKIKKSLPIIEEIVNDNNLNQYGFSLLVIEDNIKNVPISSNAFIEVDDKNGVLMEKQTGLNEQKLFTIEEANNVLDMHDIAIKLADVPILIKDKASTLPSSLSFLDMFNVSKIEQLNILNRWQVNNPVISLDTVIGVHANGDKFKLDLHEKFHGPHGLIAGSTGSGKSEFIITYILSMALNYHPYEVQFVLIDYKGGGLAGAFENKETKVKIPHLVGTITNLDIAQMNRSLVSIQSELTRRQKIFNETREALNEGTIDIYKYQKLYREGVVKKPLAHLFIICDEFAELKQQRPEFMQQLISTSRIGRSLGIHLILATQKPSGVVNDQIWANSKFKVCLKVQERSDSMEMLKRPEAASIKEAGRFYLQVGYNDLFDIGQSGWSGAKYMPSDRIYAKIDESVNYINNVGYVVKTVKDEEKKIQDEVDYGDQLTNLVKYIYNVGIKENIVTNRLWLDPIPEIIYLNDLKQKYSYKPTSYVINPVLGEFDDPVNQRQGLLNINLSYNGNLIIYGAPGSGKENLLTTLIYSIITEHTPDEVNLYILDCGAETLKIFGNMPHVGEALTIDEETKITDMFNMADQEIQKRKDLFADYAGSYNDYITNSGQKLPILIYVINNYDNFSETYGRLSDAIQPLFRDGAKYGVIFILTCITPNTLRSRSTQYFTNKIALNIPNDDYRSLIPDAPRGLIPANYFSRGLVAKDDTAYEFQTASFAEKKDITNALRNLSKILNEAYTTKARTIPSIPEIVYLNSLMPYWQNTLNVPIGYNLYTKEVNYYDFTRGITPIIALDIDDEKMAFIFSLIKMFSMPIDNNVKVFDFVKAYSKEIMGVKAINNDYEKEFMAMDKEIRQTKDSPTSNYYFILGISSLKNNLSPNAYEIVANLFQNIKDYPNSHIIIVDIYNGIKVLMLEEWYQNLGLKEGIWLGEGADMQMALPFNLAIEDKKINIPFLAIALKNDKYTIIKYVVDWEEKDE